jgi:amidase
LFVVCSVMDRRAFLATTAAATAVSTAPAGHMPLPAPPAQLQDLAEATIAQLQGAMQGGSLTARALADGYLQRITANDRQGANLHAVLETNPEAARIADDLDADRRAGRIRGPLHGIPIVVKDNVDTADRMHTSAGSLALADSIAARDAFLVERLRAAGAIILAKTNMSEWANFRSTHASSGWSGRGGQCRNPFVLDRSPSGSSSGTGAAIAASFAAAGIGTETDGSITSPASACGLVGIKPTVGLVSRAGIIPISHTQDTAGPMARTVADAAAILSVIAGEDPRDHATAGNARHASDYARALDPSALHGARIGIARKRYTGYSAKVDALFDAAVQAFRLQGAVIVDHADIVTEDHLTNEETTVLLYEFKADLNAYLAGLPNHPMRSLADLIAFNTREREREMPFFAQELFERAQAKGPLTEPAYRTALAACRRWSRALGIDATLRQHRVDAIICPTQAPTWPIDLVNGDSFGGNCTTPAAVAGYPHITVPMGQVQGLPVGLSIMGPAWSEAKLIGYAYAFEQATKARRPPAFAASVTAG